MLEALKSVPGPSFLFVFPIFAAVCICLARKWAYADGTAHLQLPDPTALEPTAIALMRGGPNAVIRTHVFGLWCDNAVTIGTMVPVGKKKAEDGCVQANASARLTSTSPTGQAIERHLLAFLREPRPVKDLFSYRNFREPLEKDWLSAVRANLRQMYLMRSEDDITRAFMAALVAGAAIATVAVSKILLGSKGGHSIEWLIVELVVSALILRWAVGHSYYEPTSLGKRYIESVEKHFAWVKTEARRRAYSDSDRTPLEGVAPAFALAIFGVDLLSGDKSVAEFTNAFHSSGSGGCGGGCGGCGGGCGGCGGCGCG